MYIIGFNGSPRSGGNTSHLMGSMLDGVMEVGAKVEHIRLQSYHIEPCVGCERCRSDKTCTRFMDGMHLLYGKLEEADGIILGCPAYNYNVTPWMKAFIDRLYPFFDFTEPRPGPYTSRLANRGKKVLVFGVCEQVDEKELGYTTVSMRDGIAAVGYGVFATLAFPGHFGASSVSRCSEDLEKARTAGKAFAESFLLQAN